MTTRKPPARRADYPRALVLQTRWMDNDAYGHVNNVVYYSYFDTLVNRFLIEEGGLDIHRAPVIGYAAETACRFHRAFAYPEPVVACMRIGHLGTSSVRYAVGLFANDDDAAAAAGHFTHVYVDRDTRRPVPLPQDLRTALEAIRS